ncbi:hypothetical protein [Cupriavidus respiraculi]|uniref:hypothetical protein n=1 Tax=Cupriavidus respiraculi TaxID=195930 RepID=UPI001F36E513|nr:hypothetical protein [Cupriavidus respiraculi]
MAAFTDFFWTFTTFSVFLPAFADDFLAASAAGDAISDTETSMVTAIERKGIEPKNLENGESDRDMIHSARIWNGASVGKKEIVSKINDLRSLIKVRLSVHFVMQKIKRINHIPILRPLNESAPPRRYPAPSPANGAAGQS